MLVSDWYLTSYMQDGLPNGGRDGRELADADGVGPWLMTISCSQRMAP